MFDVKQGKHFLKERKKKTKHTYSNGIEGFKNNENDQDLAYDATKKSDIDDDTVLVNELNILEDDFNQKRSDYATAYKSLMDKTQGYISSTDNTNLKINKNVYVNRVIDATNITPTRVGCYRTTVSTESDEYIGTYNDSGTRMMPDTTASYISYDDCKARAIKGNYKYFGLQNYNNNSAYCSFSNDLAQTQALGPTPENNIITGSDGKKYGGGWANAVYAINNVTANDSTTGLTYQSDLGSGVSIDTCKVRAGDLGASAFALRGSETPSGSSLCYVGNTVSNATSAGFAFKIITAYEFISVQGATSSGLLNNGQIGVYSVAPSGSYAGVTPNVLMKNNTPMLITIDPNTPASNSYCKFDTGALINTDGMIASYGSNCPTKPLDAMVYGNNGTVSCNKYCHGGNGTPWQGPSELPSEWKGAQCKSAGKYKTTSCDFVGQDPATPGIMPCTCTRNDNFPYETRGSPWTIRGTVPNPPIINPPTPSSGIGNWTSYIVNYVKGFMARDYVVLSEGEDPAYGCPKQFSVNYKCGNGPTKNINLDAEAAGKTLQFDCITENTVCWSYVLTINDNCTISITNQKEVDNKQEVWSWNSNITNSVPNDQYKASNGKNGRNILWTMETLELNEFIGSPSGNCHLIMATDPNTNKSGLQLRYSVFNCNDTVGNDSASNVVYQINGASKDLLGKVGFINSQNMMQEYPADMVKPSTTYDLMGNYDSPGSDISQFTMENVSTDDCKTKCSENNDCAGFVFNNSDKTCYLKNAGMFPNGLRIADDNSELYIRSKIVAGGDISCPKEMDKGISAYDWAAMPVGEKMQVSTLCKLGLVTQEEQSDLKEKNKAVLISAANLQNKLDELVKNDMNLVNNLGNHVNKLQKDLKQYTVINKKIGMNEYTIEGLRGFADDSESRLMTNTYKYFLMTVLALLLVGTIIKVARR